MLTREEVERRLADNAGASPDNFIIQAWNQALQTALAAMDERDEILIAKERDSQMAISYYNKYQEAIADRDALLAENRRLRDSLALVDDVRIALESAFLPRTAAEAERVKRLEAVLEAADDMAQEQQVTGALCAALAAYRESERPGGEDRETDGLA